MNILLTILGFLGWNWFEFVQAKDTYDNQNTKFNFREYTAKKWDNWVWTLIVAVTLYVVGHAGLGMAFITTFTDKLEWSDLYYLGSGFFSELISFSYRKWIKKETLADK